eukprot:Protomagalhaensia_sp_Gyna_25__5089@NODE_581_length_3073_cov_12_620962_g200_i1_p2_GENE_NODE_581_length_3073_cov_12_620962_g200_i1NODE_581_length_3073_cov_12_620962_g200_i1_p2_ORF_typecomplete_len238_score45_91_NODE_581_length_3073_cov_12_620962_g200_i122735
MAKEFQSDTANRLAPYIDAIFPVLPGAIAQPQSDSLCQNAAFCAGLCVELATANHTLNKMDLPSLLQSAAAASCRLSSRAIPVASEAAALDNILAMLARVITHHSLPLADSETLLSLLATHLPLKQDFHEADTVAQAITSLVLERRLDLKPLWLPVARCCVLTLASSKMCDGLSDSNIGHQLRASLSQLFSLVGQDIGISVSQFPVSTVLLEHPLIKQLASALVDPSARSFLSSCFN